MNELIEVSVRCEYRPESSDPAASRFAFAYHITISNLGTEHAQLISRHWIITDGNDKRQEVRGLGVVGAQPRIPPGESFAYTSGAMLETAVGTMQGSYRMVRDDGREFSVPIPAFRLAVSACAQLTSPRCRNSCAVPRPMRGCRRRSRSRTCC